MTPDVLRHEIEKRLTMNWLIQGASQHVGMTLHHVIKDELTAIHPTLPLWYDQLALMNQLQWWRPLPAALFGWPPVSWRLTGRTPWHPFYRHPLLAVYGGSLAEAARRRAVERARTKGVWRWPLTFSTHNAIVLGRIRVAEARSLALVTQAACRAASLAWGIDPSRFNATLAPSGPPLPPFAPLRRSGSIRAGIFLAGAIGWGGVTRDHDGNLCVRAVARNGYYLCKELVKGTAELIGLHGLGRMDDVLYERVMQATDRVELEPAMLQSGGELWRLLLFALPQNVRPADMLMRIAQAPNASVVDVLRRVIEQTSDAGDRLRSFCEAA